MGRAKWDDFGPRYQYLVSNYGVKTQAEIAKKLGLQRDQVRKWAHFLGLQSPRASKPLPPGLLDSILADWGSGRYELEDLAVKYEVSRECVWARIRCAKRKKETEHRKKLSAVFSTIAAMCGNEVHGGNSGKTKRRDENRAERGQHRPRAGVQFLPAQGRAAGAKLHVARQ